MSMVPNSERPLRDSVRYTLPQAVNFDNLPDLRELVEAEVDAAEPDRVFEVAIGDQGHGGSAAVALMIALFRRAHVLDKKIRFVEVPIEISNIVNVSGLSDVLPLQLAEQVAEQVVEAPASQP
jgi:ABC-type transporter Mla MlaB component